MPQRGRRREGNHEDNDDKIKNDEPQCDDNADEVKVLGSVGRAWVVVSINEWQREEFLGDSTCEAW